MNECNCISAACACGSCEGVRTWTPVPIANRPGLAALRRRVGTHGEFLATMKARLAAMTVESSAPDGTPRTLRPLAGLTTRAADDPTIAVLDAWATIGDVLTFYQERIADEGYLRTARERRSVVELSRLVGYVPRPGVAATVHLVYTVDESQTEPVEIPAGARSQSIPGPDEMPQPFETSESLVARAEWNNLQVQLTTPQAVDSETAPEIATLHVAGTGLNVKPGDVLVLTFAGDAAVVRTVAAAQDQFAEKRTALTLIPGGGARVAPASRGAEAFAGVVAAPSAAFVAGLIKPALRQPANSTRLARSLDSALAPGSDVLPRLLLSVTPRLKDTFYPAWASAVASPAPSPLTGVHLLRASSSLFGAGVSRQPAYETVDEKTPEGVPVRVKGQLKPPSEWIEWSAASDEDPRILYLEFPDEAFLAGSYVLVRTSDGSSPVVARVTDALTLQRSAYGISGKTTRLVLDQPWVKKLGSLGDLRGVLVRGRSEELSLVDAPVATDVVAGQEIELERLYGGLESGRWVIFSGERADIPGVTGVKGAELLMIAGVRQSAADVPGARTRTTLVLATPAAYAYKRSSLAIHGNVAKATHGETRSETLGGGDGSRALQTFELKQPPLTFVAAPTAAGAASTLRVFVNDVEWRERPTLVGLAPGDRAFVTSTGDDDRTAVIFGDGHRGARLPTGLENVKARYRGGIGAEGNVRAGQVSMLQTPVLGVKAVSNPLRASGGAGREDRDTVRENAPVAVTALDRLVSVQDYADFARTFAGVGKAAAVMLGDGTSRFVHVTVAGVDDGPIDPASDLNVHLTAALRRFGDPAVAVRVEPRELVVLLLSMNLRLAPDFQWEPVVAEVRATLLDRFGFAKRALGEHALLSRVIAAVQGVRGVAYADVDVFTGVSEAQIVPSAGAGADRRRARVLAGAGTASPRVEAGSADFADGAVRPARLAVFPPTVPDVLILNEIP